MFKPLGEKLYLKKSTIHGHGIFAKISLDKDESLHISHVNAPGDYGGLFDNGLIRTASGSYVNHSGDPNATLDEWDAGYLLCSIRKIKKDEEVTINYSDHACGVGYDLSNFKK